MTQPPGPLLQSPLLGHSPGAARDREDGGARAELRRRVALGVQLSLAANVLLLVAKSAAYFYTGSMAVAASALDSLVDLGSQAMVALAEAAVSRCALPPLPAALRLPADVQGDPLLS
jgi:hypothetical protein